MRIGYLPLDSRPCNYRWPVELAQWCGHDCIVPGKHLMDWFYNPAQYEGSKAFLETAAQECDALVVSIDHLCYGSLLASREYGISYETALARLSILEKIRRKRADLPLLACGVIMRSSISSIVSPDMKAYHAMTRYSYYSALYEQTRSEAMKAEADKAEAEIPAEVFDKYFRARKRNAIVNKECIRLAADGVLSSLLLLQEDSETMGFHTKEQLELRALVSEKKADNVWLHNGADEGGSVAVMKAIGGNHRFHLEQLDENGANDFVAKYEDRPFGENVRSYISYAGLLEDSDSPYVLAIATPSKGFQADLMQTDVSLASKRHAVNSESEVDKHWLEQIADKIARLCKAGKQVYLLDVLSANGGNMKLMKALSQRIDLMNLAGYSSWNTASNSLGTAMAQLISDQLAGKANRAFLSERLIDDLIYQSSVRRKLNEWIRAKGEDDYNLSDEETTAARAKLEQLMSEFCIESGVLSGFPKCEMSFPWNRTFEIDVRMKK